MFASLTERAHAEVSVVKAFVATHEAAIAEAEEGERTRLRLFAVSASVTRLYAIYERFVEDLISDYLDALPEILAFKDIPVGMQTDYRIGVSHILSRLDNRRYRSLNHENLIRWYHEALSGHSPYRFVSQAITRHEENLRFGVLAGLLGRIQIGSDDLKGWMSNHAAIQSLYEDPTAVWERLESEVGNFIEVRNDAAHGTLSNLLGSDSILRICDLVSAVIDALSSLLFRRIVHHKLEGGKAMALGSVTEVFRAAGAFILRLEQGSGLSVGNRISLVGTWACVEAKVESLQLDDRMIEGASAALPGLEVGVVASAIPRRGWSIVQESGRS